MSPRFIMKKITIGLTGSLGSGKSFAAALFKKHGVNVVSADDLAKRVLAEDADTRPELVRVLGDVCFMPNGAPDTKKIAEAVFSDSEKLRKIEEMLHPRALLLWQTQAEKFEGLSVLEIPLLFEKKLEKLFDICATVFCSGQIRLERLAQRGMSPNEIAARDKFQMSVADKLKLADIAFFNEGSAEFLEAQILIFVDKLYGRRK